jgi:hypothetical protein
MTTYATTSVARGKFRFSVAGTPTDPVSLALAVYDGDSTTESTTGVTLATVPFDGRTGLIHWSVDLSTYAVDTDYQVIATAGTLGGKDLAGTVIAEFTTRLAPVNVTEVSGAAASADTTLETKIDTIDANVDAILVDTGTTLPATLAALNDLSAAQVNAEVDTALADYDPPTRTEATADKAEIIARGDVAWVTGAGGSSPTVEQIRAEIDANSTQLAAILADTGTSIPALIAALNDLSAAQVNAEVDTALADYDPPTRAEATADKAELAAAVAAVPTAGEIHSEVASSFSLLNGLHLQTQQDIAGFDTLIDAVKAKTDQLAFTVAGQVDANALSGGGGGTAEEIADAVWDEALADHTTAGTAGAGVAAASASGDPWATVLPGAYADGTAGAGIGRLNNTPPDEPVIVIPDPAADNSLCTVYGYTEDLTGTVVEGATITFELSAGASKSNKLLTTTAATATTDVDGFFSLTLQRTDLLTPTGRTYYVTAPTLGLHRVPMTLTADTVDLASLIT